MELKIRKATKADIPFIVDFQLEMAKETEQLVLDRDRVGKGVQAVFERSGLGEYYVAETEGRVVASLMLTYEWSDWRNSLVLWIQSVYVMPAFRMAGVFRQMYLHIKDKVDNSEELGGIRLYVDNTNLKARQVYDRLGMNGDHYSVYEWIKPH